MSQVLHTMESMFKGATAFNVDITKWLVTIIVNMNQMFQNATAFKQNVGFWGLTTTPGFQHLPTCLKIQG